METNENLIPIPGRLHSVATEGHVAGADEIFDDSLNKNQATINQEVNEAIGTGGSVDSRISAAINALDASVSKSAGADGLSLSVTEENGKVTAINGSIAANTYDANGAAAAAKSEVLGSGVGTDYNTLKKIEDKLSPIEAAVGTGGSIDQRIEDATEDCAYLGANDGSAVIADFDPQTDTVWKKAQTLSNAEKSQVKTNLGLPQEIYSKTEVNELVSTPHQNYVTVATYSELPVNGSTDTIYRVSNYDGTQVATGVYSEYAWNGSDYVFLAAKSSVGEVFNISEYHAGAKYADLAAALDSNNRGGVPQSLQKGGMSVKFVSNSDNKYVQYYLKSTSFDTTISSWVNIEDSLDRSYINVPGYTGFNTFIKDYFSELYISTPDGKPIDIYLYGLVYNANGLSFWIYDANWVEICSIYQNNTIQQGVVTEIPMKGIYAENGYKAYAVYTGNTTVVTRNTGLHIQMTDNLFYLNRWDKITNYISNLPIKLQEEIDELKPKAKPNFCRVPEADACIEELYIPTIDDYSGMYMYRLVVQESGELRLFLRDANSGSNNIVQLGATIDKLYWKYGAITPLYKKSDRSLIGWVKLRLNGNGYSADAYHALNSNIIKDINNSPKIKAMLNNSTQILLWGDSKFGLTDERNTFQDILMGLTGMRVYQCGFGGCDMAWRTNDGSSEYDKFSAIDIADALVSQDFSEQIAAAAIVGSRDNIDYSIQMEALQSIDLTKDTIVVLNYCGNDWNQNIPIGDEFVNELSLNSYDKHKYLDSMNYAVQKMLTAYPKLYFITCGPWYTIKFVDGNYISYYDMKNSLGKTYMEYIEALKQNSEKLGLRYIDYSNVGVQNYFGNKASIGLITPEGHMSAYGYARVAKWLQKEIDMVI